MNMKVLFLTVCLGLLSNGIFAQNSAFETAMKNALVAHDTASTAQSELLAIEQCKKISKQFPDAWLPHFWAAYFATQVTRYPSTLEEQKREDAARSYLTQAQESLDRAIERVLPDAMRIRSSIMALQSLIYSFQSSLSMEEGLEKYATLYKDTFSNAINASPDNPVVHVLLATDLIKEGNANKDGRKILAGKILLQEAGRTFDLFEQSQIHTSLTSHFNQEWVDFWIGYADKLLGSG